MLQTPLHLLGNLLRWASWAYDASTVCRGLHTVHYIRKSRKTWPLVSKCCQTAISQNAPPHQLGSEKFASRLPSGGKEIMNSEDSPARGKNAAKWHCLTTADTLPTTSASLTSILQKLGLLLEKVAIDRWMPNRCHLEVLHMRLFRSKLLHQELAK